MLTAAKLKELRKKAEEAVADMSDNNLKITAFEVMLNHLLDTEVESEPTRRMNEGKDKDPIRITAPKKDKIGKTLTGKGEIKYIEIVQKVMECPESEGIESNILNRGSQVDRALLPIYIVHEYFENAYGLSTGDINKISTELGIPLSIANASHTLTGTARKYVIASEMSKRGRRIVYKLHRKGVDYLKSVISGKPNEK